MIMYSRRSDSEASRHWSGCRVLRCLLLCRATPHSQVAAARPARRTLTSEHASGSYNMVFAQVLGLGYAANKCVTCEKRLKALDRVRSLRTHLTAYHSSPELCGPPRPHHSPCAHSPPRRRCSSRTLRRSSSAAAGTAAVSKGCHRHVHRRAFN